MTTRVEGLPGAVRSRSGDTLAVRNTVIVAGSLVATWSVALLVRLVLPRHLGPALFGQYAFAEALAINGFAVLGFGIDVYIQKEVPRRPEHAADFVGGVQVLRVAGAVLVLAGIAAVAAMRGRSSQVIGTAIAFGVAQLCILLANTWATLLYAARRVGRLSVLNIATKVVWGLGIVLAMVVRAHLWVFAVASALAEALRLGVLSRLTREVSDLRARLNARATFAALRKSAPFFLNQVAIALYAKIDVAIMGLLVTDRELGFYGAATNVSSVALLMSPFVGWVLTPQLSRVVSDRPAFMSMLRRALEWTLVLAIPMALMLGLGADVMVRSLFGPRFVPAVAAMRTLMPIFVVVYVAILGATALILLDRSWTVTLVTVLSLIANATLNVLFIPRALHAWGEGGAGVGAAAVSVSTEAVVAATYIWLLRREILDARNVLATLKSLAACAAVMAFHVAARPLGALRLPIDMALYASIALATGTVRASELAVLVRSLKMETSHENP